MQLLVGRVSGFFYFRQFSTNKEEEINLLLTELVCQIDEIDVMCLCVMCGCILPLYHRWEFELTNIGEEGRQKQAIWQNNQISWEAERDEKEEEDHTQTQLG